MFRLGAIVLGLGLVLLVEGVLRLSGMARPEVSEDAFVGFSGDRPLFERSDVGKHYETALSRTNYFVRDRFVVAKRPETFRAFFLGGSTVQGRPYAIDTAFPKWMQLSLEASDPSHHWEMVNCGGISYASYRLVSILEECLDHYQPDLIVLCTGQNEYLEERTYGAIKEVPKGVRWGQRYFGSWHLYHLLDRAWDLIRMREGLDGESSLQTVRPILPSEVDAFLDYENGLEAYHWDPGWRRGVGNHFEHNIERMIRLCRKAAVPMLILSPPVNLRSSPPFKSEHRADLDAQELDEWQRCLEQARRNYIGDPDKAVSWLRKARRIDPQFAETHFALGTMLEGMGRRQEARASFLQAKEYDVCPLRMLKSERESLAALADRFNVPMIDLHAFLEDQSDFLTLGSDLLVDHVHPSIRGHQLIAGEILKVFAGEGWLNRAPIDSTKEIYQKHLDSLGPTYYLHGKMRLENLMRWTEGRTGGLPIELKPETKVE